MILEEESDNELYDNFVPTDKLAFSKFQKVEFEIGCTWLINRENGNIWA